MPALMKHHLTGDPSGFHGGKEIDAMCRLDIPIRQTMYQKHRCLEPVGRLQVIAHVPPAAVVAAVPVLICRNSLQPGGIRLPNGRIVLRVLGTAEAVFGQNVQVVALPADGGQVQTVAAVVVIPVGNGGFGNDGFQSLHTGGGDRDTHRPQVALAGHGHLAGAPVRPDLNVVRQVGKGPAAAVEPVDDRLECRRLLRGTAAVESLGSPGTQAAAEHGGVATGVEVAVPVADAVQRDLLRWRGIRIADGGPGVSGLGEGYCGRVKGDVRLGDVLLGIGTHIPVHIVGDIPILITLQHVGVGHIDRGHPHPLSGFQWAADVDCDQIQSAVSVCIYRRLHIDLLKQTPFIIKNRLRQAVLQHNTRYMLFHKNVLLSEERLTYPDFSSGSASKPTPCLRPEATLR